jgi:hypothetical protein
VAGSGDFFDLDQRAEGRSLYRMLLISGLSVRKGGPAESTGRQDFMGKG